MSGKNRAAPITFVYLVSAALLFLLASSSRTTNEPGKTHAYISDEGPETAR